MVDNVHNLLNAFQNGFDADLHAVENEKFPSGRLNFNSRLFENWAHLRQALDKFSLLNSEYKFPHEYAQKILGKNIENIDKQNLKKELLNIKLLLKTEGKNLFTHEQIASLNKEIDEALRGIAGSQLAEAVALNKQHKATYDDFARKAQIPAPTKHPASLKANSIDGILRHSSELSKALDVLIPFTGNVFSNENKYWGPAFEDRQALSFLNAFTKNDSFSSIVPVTSPKQRQFYQAQLLENLTKLKNLAAKDPNLKNWPEEVSKAIKFIIDNAPASSRR